MLNVIYEDKDKIIVNKPAGQLSADCGLAWRMEPSEYEQKKEQIHTFGIETDQSVELVI